jgi:hypothetical protein
MVVWSELIALSSRKAAGPDSRRPRRAPVAAQAGPEDHLPGVPAHPGRRTPRPPGSGRSPRPSSPPRRRTASRPTGSTCLPSPGTAPRSVTILRPSTMPSGEVVPETAPRPRGGTSGHSGLAALAARDSLRRLVRVVVGGRSWRGLVAGHVRQRSGVRVIAPSTAGAVMTALAVEYDRSLRRLGGLNAVTGANGSGKSSPYQARGCSLTPGRTGWSLRQPSACAWMPGLPAGFGVGR